MRPAARFLSALWLALLPAVYAGGSEYMLKPITLNDGLSQNTVKSILYDNKGYLWMGTRYGLNRYDQRNITTYFADGMRPGYISDNDVHIVFEDSRDTIWVAGENGLTRYDQLTDSFIPVKYGSRQINITSYCETPDGLLLGGYGRLYFYNYDRNQLELIDSEGGSSNSYNRILPWTGGKFLLETRSDGMWKYDPADNTVSRSGICGDTDIMASYADSKGRLWVSPYNDGLRCYSASGELLQEIKAATSGLSNNIVIDMLEHDGNLWIATEKGIDILEMDTGRFSRLNSHGMGATGTVLKLYKDDYGNMYAGTLRRGVICIYTVAMRTYTGMSGDSYNSDFIVTSIYSDDNGTVWCGIDGGGVARMDTERDWFRRVGETAGLKVTWVSPYDDDRLIVSTFDKGIYLLDKKTENISPAPQPYSGIAAADAKKGLSLEILPISDNRDIMVNDRIYIVNRESGTARKIPNDNAPTDGDKLYAFYRDQHKVLLHGTHNIISYDIDRDSLRPVVDTDKSIVVKCAQFDGHRTIYIGTNRGLYKYDTIDHDMNKVDTKFIRNITSLVLDGKRLWIGADNVLYLLNDGKLMMFNSYNGVASNEFINKSHFLTPDYLFMGGINGLQKIGRGMIDDMMPVPEDISLGIADIKVDGVSAFTSLADGRIEVPSNHSTISVSIIDREQNAMRNKLFRFYIDGMKNNGPIETFDRTLSLNMLPSGGTYKISVACSLPDGSWTAPTEVVQLHVLAPWWESWWAISVYILAGMAAVYALYRYFHLRKRRQMDDLKRKTLEREVGFLSNINYELRTPLSLIYAPLKVLIHKLKHDSGTDPETIKGLEQIYRHTKEMRDVINMPLELWHVETTSTTVTPERCHFNTWLQHEVEASAPSIGLRRIHLSYSLDDNIGEAVFDRARMGIVLSNMLVAAIKHSPTGAVLEVTSQLDGDSVRVEIHDQGESLSESEIRRVFSGHYNNHLYGAGLGLAYAKMLLEPQQGKIGVESDPDKHGVTIWLEIPRELPIAPESTEETAPDQMDLPLIPGGVVDVFDTSGSTAIVVEDNEELCMFMVSHLQEIFKKVYYAFNGRDALMMIKRDSPDIVIADGILPVLGGFDLCRDIKLSPELQHIPVILLTAGAAETEKLKSYALGADSYISKPFDVNVLISRCKNLLLNRDIMRNRYKNATSGMAIEEKKFSNADESFLMKIDQIIAAEISSPDFGVDRIVELMLMSRSALYVRFKELTGKSIGNHINDYRLMRAKDMLRHKAMSISEIAEALGFRSQRYFSTFFKDRCGVTPSAYRTSGFKTIDDE